MLKIQNKYLKFFLIIIIIWALSFLFGLIADKFIVVKLIDKYSYALFRKTPHLKIIDALIWPFDNNYLPILQPHPSFLVTLYGTFLIYLAIFKRRLFVWGLLALLIATIISRIILQIDTFLIFRQRPYTILPNDVSEIVKNSLKNWTSYPSGHTRDTALYGTIISIFLKKSKYFMVLLVIFVGFSRLYLGIHYMSDVLAGALIGISIGVVSINIIRELQRKYLKEPIV